MLLLEDSQALCATAGSSDTEVGTIVGHLNQIFSLVDPSSSSDLTASAGGRCTSKRLPGAD